MWSVAADSGKFPGSTYTQFSCPPVNGAFPGANITYRKMLVRLHDAFSEATIVKEVSVGRI
jgi:hypothetical protein